MQNEFSRLCACGCGTPIPLVSKHHGQPQRFVHGHNVRRPLEERFWEKVRKSDGCWLWTGATDSKGYGEIGTGRGHIAAHRLAYELVHGPFDPALHVCHRCDVPACVRPEHLFLGTHTDNMRDMTTKGRRGTGYGIKGERNCNARVTADTVLAIRKWKADGGTGTRAAAARFGVSLTHFKRLAKGDGWPHLA